MKIVVIGGTGLIGSKVVARLSEDGHEAVPASPRLGINSITGEGLAAALDGASVVVDVSNSPNFEFATALDFFATSTHHLLVAEAAAGVGHHVALSVVGTKELSEGGDLTKTTAGYFLAKLVEEALIRTSGIPYSIVHATQFFEFIKSIADVSTDGSTVRLPPVAFQPMAAADVVKAVARVAVGTPVNGVVETDLADHRPVLGHQGPFAHGDAVIRRRRVDNDRPRVVHRRQGTPDRLVEPERLRPTDFHETVHRRPDRDPGDSLGDVGGRHRLEGDRWQPDGAPVRGHVGDALDELEELGGVDDRIRDPGRPDQGLFDELRQEIAGGRLREVTALGQRFGSDH